MRERSVAVIGSGYVGLTTGACLASLGHRVTCADIDEWKVATLKRGDVPFLEPGLPELVAEGIGQGRLSFTVGTRQAVSGAEMVFLCLPTPMGAGGTADVSAIELAVTEISDVLPAGSVVVNKSTAPVGTVRHLTEIVDRGDVAVTSNPEFLREGSAVHDFLHPDRIIIGGDEPGGAERVAELYSRLDAPVLLTDSASAELAKYAANCFLATKLSYVNAIAELCDRLGADIRVVTRSMGYDQRIGHTYLSPGPGWGGSCLPKDSQSLLRIADSVDFEFRLLRAAIDTNDRQARRIAEKVRTAITGDRHSSLRGARIGVLGLTFKAGTDDLRESPSLAVATLLRQAGAQLVGHDPGLRLAAAYPDLVGMQILDDPITAAKDADALVVLTEWSHFRSLDWAEIADVMNRAVVVDARNVLDPENVVRLGFAYHGLGIARHREAHDDLTVRMEDRDGDQ